jgi:hypothetical protein
VSLCGLPATFIYNSASSGSVITHSLHSPSSRIPGRTSPSRDRKVLLETRLGDILASYHPRTTTSTGYQQYNSSLELSGHSLIMTLPSGPVDPLVTSLDHLSIDPRQSRFDPFSLDGLSSLAAVSSGMGEDDATDHRSPPLQIRDPQAALTRVSP